MEFKQFNEIMKWHIASITEGEKYLFETDVSPYDLWDKYLDSFPEGTNEIFRERREMDCSACRQFVKALGNVVVIRDNKLISIWDFEVGDHKFQTVIDTLSSLVKSCPVKDVFITPTRIFGVEKSTEILDSGEVQTWHHMRADVSDTVRVFGQEENGSEKGRMRDNRNVLERSIKEITIESVDIILEMIAQRTLYKGEEWQGPLEKFRGIHEAYHRVPEDEKGNYCWTTSVAVGPAISRIKNHSIGVLLMDISGGMNLDDAVKRYEKIVAPTNYKRPKAIFTKQMVAKAKETVKGLGLEDSLGRRHAKLEDITVNNILWANRDVARKMKGDVFDDLSESVPDKPKSLEGIGELPIDVFVENVLPAVSEMEVLLDGHDSNLVSLIAPTVATSKSMLKWPNGFSWAYSGNITDSMKQRVKAAGGKVDGDLRFSIQWNENSDNYDDLDAHCKEPGGVHIYFGNRGHVHASSGMLDVDIINPQRYEPAVENIIWTDRSKMEKGVYQLYVNNYSARGASSGFSAEVEFGGRIFSFRHDSPLKQDEIVNVAEVTFDGENFSIKKCLSAQESGREVWGLMTQKFHPVSAFMYSPNYWDGHTGVGHRHYFFMINGCLNNENPNGFFNEFLKDDLTEHKRVFEALGSKMRVADSDDQLSGLGFSATKRASLVVKVKGSFNRVVRLKF